MSFRTRLTSFFLLIVIVPMVAIGVLGFRLISDSERGKADARAGGLAAAAASVYESAIAQARTDAAAVARDPALQSAARRRARLAALASSGGLARATVIRGGVMLADVGDRTAVAPGVATVRRTGHDTPLSVAVSELTAAQYARQLSSHDAEVVVRQGSRTLAATVPGAQGLSFPTEGTVHVGDDDYRAVTLGFPGFGSGPVDVTVLSNLSATNASLRSSRAVAVGFIIGFLMLALAFALVASRALQAQLGGFLQAARRLAAGDFSSPIETQGHDEFAALGEEFNNMSTQLAHRLDELSQERARLRESISRIGQTFASNLDRHALLELALKTAVDAVQGSSGRLSIRPAESEPLVETAREGSFEGLAVAISAAEREVELEGAGVCQREFGDDTTDHVSVLAASLGAADPEGRAHGVLTVARRGRPFSDDDRELVRSLASQATLALENVELHLQVSRQAVTDELTGLANHGRFQEVLGSEMEQVRRYQYPVGLIMLDIDDFKSINDTYGHPQGDVVLRHVARIVRENSRDADSPARYGGEEMALILPHTDLEGSHAIAERVRTAIAGLRISRLDGQGTLRITASVGVAASSEGLKDGLIADADAALYEAKRAGKNRTVRASPRTANVSGPE
ncbi:MAG: diguanylate cyclase [Solirubrobacteraceae bacterium]